MAVLTIAASLAAVVAVAGCYDPELASCTVACTEAADCGGGQRCTSDGLCAGPEIEGTCEDATADATTPADGASAADAAALDGPTTMLRVVIDGRGKIRLRPLQVECRTAPMTEDMVCTYEVAVALALDAEARDHEHWTFDRWTSPNCADTPDSTCALVTGPGVTLVGARFVDTDDDD